MEEESYYTTDSDEESYSSSSGNSEMQTQKIDKETRTDEKGQGINQNSDSIVKDKNTNTNDNDNNICNNENRGNEIDANPVVLFKSETENVANSLLGEENERAEECEHFSDGDETKKNIEKDGTTPETEGIPPGLLPIIYHAPTSPTYQALQGKQINGLNNSMKTSIINDLKKYLDLAVDHSLIAEACYIQTVIDNLKSEKCNDKEVTNRDISAIDLKIKETNKEIEERNQFWDSQQEILNRETEMSLQEVEVQRSLAVSQLDSEWQSSKKQQQYSKPSPALLNMRDQVKKMIKAKKFDEATQVGKLIAEREKIEVAEATQRMNADYRAADARIQEKFDQEQVVIMQTHESKSNTLIRSREVSLRPILQRLENLTKQKEVLMKGMKKTTTRSAVTTQRDGHQIQSQPLPDLINQPKLLLPAVTPLKRETSKQVGSIIRPKTSASMQRSRQGSRKSSPRLADKKPGQRFSFNQ